jgi:hypothetical protein
MSQREPSPEELQAALEEEMKKVHVDDLLLQSIVSLVNLAGRRAGLAPGTEAERDVDQLGTAIEAVRTMLPLVESRHGDDLAPIRNALSQLQMAYAQLRGPGQGGTPGGEEPAPGGGEPPRRESEPSRPEEPGGAPGQGGPAQRSGRLWVPGS